DGALGRGDADDGFTGAKSGGIVAADVRRQSELGQSPKPDAFGLFLQLLHGAGRCVADRVLEVRSPFPLSQMVQNVVRYERGYWPELPQHVVLRSTETARRADHHQSVGAAKGECGRPRVGGEAVLPPQ